MWKPYCLQTISMGLVPHIPHIPHELKYCIMVYSIIFPYEIHLLFPQGILTLGEYVEYVETFFVICLSHPHWGAWLSALKGWNYTAQGITLGILC